LLQAAELQTQHKTTHPTLIGSHQQEEKRNWTIQMQPREEKQCWTTQRPKTAQRRNTETHQEKKITETS